MFKKILVACRGDIAVRIIQNCREIGVESVAVCSEADLKAFHTNLATKAYCIGPAELEKSYYNIDAILCTAVNCGADAIHPGYGPLSESVELSRRCRELGITFIGASPELLELIHNKDELEKRLKEAGVPVSKRLGSLPKQIDIQLVCDSTGNIVVVGDRDASICHGANRLIYEAPAYGISEKVRKKLYKSAVAAARSIGFVGVGSIIFFVDNSGKYYFKKFVPRLQVGCSVTEMHSRIDLIHWGIRLSAGDLINFGESTICRFGHAIACRIFAVHPESLLPSPGKIDILHIPEGLYVQFYTSVYQGYTMPREYQPLLGNLIVYSRTRPHAIRKLRSAIGELVTEGVYNNSEIYSQIISDEAFASGEYDISFYDAFMRDKLRNP
ncbi:MAG: hypothetical protein IJ389_04720 [Clostridia bacterium]|nr:hypothetical protein [Clostridia bacterium]